MMICGKLFHPPLYAHIRVRVYARARACVFKRMSELTQSSYVTLMHRFESGGVDSVGSCVTFSSERVTPELTVARQKEREREEEGGRGGGREREEKRERKLTFQL